MYYSSLSTCVECVCACVCVHIYMYYNVYLCTLNILVCVCLGVYVCDCVSHRYSGVRVYVCTTSVRAGGRSKWSPPHHPSTAIRWALLPSPLPLPSGRGARATLYDTQNTRP